MKRQTPVHFVTFTQRPDSSRTQISIMVPPHLRQRFEQDPQIAKLGWRCDSRGRVRKSLGRIPPAQMRQIVQEWEQLLATKEIDHLTETLAKAVKIALFPRKQVSTTG